MQTKFAGFFLILVGLIIMVIRSNSAPIASFISWPFILFVFGALLIFVAYVKANAQLALWGGIFAAIGISIWGSKYVEGWPTHWSILIALIGVAFLLQFSISKQNIYALIGGVLLICGIFAWPGIQNLPLISPVARVLHSYWPVFVVGLGLVFVLRK